MLIPLVSVIVPTYNRSEKLAVALQSILLQSHKNFEVIVVNDGGIDVEALISPLRNAASIKYISNEKNIGPSGARNAGIKEASGKYIAYLDDDDVYYSDHLETLVNHFLDNQNVKVAYTDAFTAYYKRKCDRDVLTKKDLWSPDFDYEEILLRNLILNPSSVMHEKACIDEVGFFDEELRTNEDWEFWIRLSRRFRFSHIKKATTEICWSFGRNSITTNRVSDFVRTTEIIYARYKVYAEANPHLCKLQEKHLEVMKSRTDNKRIRIEKLKLLLFRFIGIRGVNFLYRIKLNFKTLIE